MNFSDQSTPLHLEALTNAAKEAVIHVETGGVVGGEALIQ